MATRSFTHLLFGVGLMAASAPALEARNVVSQSVSYADLDLSKRGDARRLELRIDNAISRLCGDPGAARNGFELAQTNTCRDKAKANVAPQLALAHSRNGKDRQVAISIAPR
jgi:UrcA family protein